MSQLPDSPEALSPTKRALLALKQLQARVEELEQAQAEPIAIVGIGCRFPGGVESPADFWELLRQGKDAITEVPGDRWNLDTYYHPDPDHPGTMNTRQGGFVPHLWDFDAAFFRIAPREALSLDPQQRLLLEVVWEALEHAAIAPEQLTGSPTGVFVGICSIDHWHELLARSPANIDAYLATGNTHSVAAGRISYLLGLTGPSLAIDTACSSSLAAVHLACQSLRNGECTQAIAGGVNRILSPASSINFTKARMLSPEGRCKSFDASADGFVRAEGCGLVVLKRLKDAIAAQDPIWAVILGSATNHDGRTSGLTVPNGPAQQAVIRQALQNSRIRPHQVDYLETHGTGTALGDPIEVGALQAIFGGDRPAHQPLILGAVKTQIGHLEAASGIAGLIKAVLALHHQEIPANLHYQTPSPHIQWDGSIQFPTEPIPWHRGDRPRIAGVSAFGFNGSNAHVVIADTQPLREVPPCAIAPLLLPLSARSELALRELTQRYERWLSQKPAVTLADLCATASIGRSHFSHRLVFLSSSLEHLLDQLHQWNQGNQPDGVHQGRVQASLPSFPNLPDPTHPTDWETHLSQLAQAYLQGAAIAWDSLYQKIPHRRIPLPTYPFQRQRYCALDESQ